MRLGDGDASAILAERDFETVGSEGKLGVAHHDATYKFGDVFFAVKARFFCGSDLCFRPARSLASRHRKKALRFFGFR